MFFKVYLDFQSNLSLREVFVLSVSMQISNQQIKMNNSSPSQY